MSALPASLDAPARPASAAVFGVSSPSADSAWLNGEALLAARPVAEREARQARGRLPSALPDHAALVSLVANAPRLGDAVKSLLRCLALTAGSVERISAAYATGCVAHGSTVSRVIKGGANGRPATLAVSAGTAISIGAFYAALWHLDHPEREWPNPTPLIESLLDALVRAHLRERTVEHT